MRVKRDVAVCLSAGLGLTAASVLVGFATECAMVSNGHLPGAQSGHEVLVEPGLGVTTLSRCGPFVRVVQVMEGNMNFSLLDAETARILGSLRLVPHSDLPFHSSDTTAGISGSAWIRRFTYLRDSHAIGAGNSMTRQSMRDDLPEWFTDGLRANPRGGKVWQVQVEDGLGWPFVAVTGSMAFAAFTRESPHFDVSTSGALLLDDHQAWSESGLDSAPFPWSIRMLPFRPVAVGTAVDVAFWTALWGVATIATRYARGRSRRLASRCLGCGYQLADSPGLSCPECGRSR